ncbi:MAG: hypothetical protein P8K76_17530 [Candidatus Binatia bacterium]|nr:hypothetical protein [Candidatus Binatia bacterium]MDG2011566.1 hypothetical protein [Candidatus Binatia bacterium]
MLLRLLVPALLVMLWPMTQSRATTPTPQPTPTAIPGTPITVDGTIFALSCLLREPSQLADLADCSRASLANGASLAIREAKTGRIFGIAAAAPASDPAGMAREYIAEEVRIRGRLYRRSDFTILVPETIQGALPTPGEDLDR